MPCSDDEATAAYVSGVVPAVTVIPGGEDDAYALEPLSPLQLTAVAGLQPAVVRRASSLAPPGIENAVPPSLPPQSPTRIAGDAGSLSDAACAPARQELLQSLLLFCVSASLPSESERLREDGGP